jgi:predicted ATPase
MSIETQIAPKLDINSHLSPNAHLKRLTIENFKAFQKCVLDLVPLTFFIGENSAGKSSLLQALLLLKQTLESPSGGGRLNLDSHYVQFHQFREMVFGMPPDEAIVGFELDFEQFRLSFKVGAKNQEQDLTLLEMQLNEEPLSIQTLPEQLPILAYLMTTDMKCYVELLKIFNGLGYLQPVRPFPQRYYHLRGIKPDWIGIQAENLADFLENFPAVKRQVRDWFVKTAKMARDVKMKGDRQRGQTEILVTETTTGLEIDISRLGFGYSQILPIVVATFTPKNLLIFEAPEIHLNPSLHGALADLFIDSAKKGKQILVETHSESLIYRVQRRIAEGKIAADEVAIYFVRRGAKGSIAERLTVTDDGEISDWPDGFFDAKMQDIFERVIGRPKKAKNQ